MNPEGSALPFVSVIIPVRDDAGRLARCLAAIERQTYPAGRREVLVADDGSRDDVPGALARCPGARHLPGPPLTSFAARNRGIEAARGAVLAFTDADCRPHEAWLAEGVRALQALPGPGLVAGRIRVTRRSPRRLSPAEAYELALAFRQDRNVRFASFGASANLLVDARAMAALGGFRGDLASNGDRELCLRAIHAGFPLAYAPLAAVDHPALVTVGALLRRARFRARGAAQVAPLDAALRRARARRREEAAAACPEGGAPSRPSASGLRGHLAGVLQRLRWAATEPALRRAPDRWAAVALTLAVEGVTTLERLRRRAADPVQWRPRA